MSFLDEQIKIYTISTIEFGHNLLQEYRELKANHVKVSEFEDIFANVLLIKMLERAPKVENFDNV